MNNARGSSLAIALSMVFLFGALGVGALEYGGGQRQYAATLTANAQAFWLADGGLQTVCASGTVPLTPVSLGGIGSYSVTPTGAIVSGNLLTSTGTVGFNPLMTRRIQAICTSTNINNIFKTPYSAQPSATPVSIPSAFSSLLPLQWSNTTTYSVNNSVIYQNSIWQSLQNLNKNNIPSLGSTWWGQSITQWSSTTTYSVNSYVMYNNELWHSLRNLNTNNQPDTSPTDWQENAVQCPGGGSSWNVTSNTTFSGSGNYECNNLSVASGVTLIINTPVVLYLTASGEDITGGTSPNPANMGAIQINPGGSLTIYAVGRITLGNSTDFPGINTPSDVVLNNTTAQSSDFIIFSLYTGAGAGVEIGSPNFLGLIYAPQSLVTVNANETVTGSIVGNSVTVDTGATVNYDNSLLNNTEAVTYSLSNWTEIS